MILEDKLGKNEKDHIAHILINTSSQKLACAKIYVVQATCLLSIVRNSGRISINGNGSKCGGWLRTIQNWHYVTLVSTRPKPFTKTLGKKTCKTLVFVRCCLSFSRFPLIWSLPTLDLGKWLALVPKNRLDHVAFGLLPPDLTNLLQNETGKWWIKASSGQQLICGNYPH